MPWYIQFICDLIIFWFFFGGYVTKHCRTASSRRRFQLSELEATLKKYLLRNRDILESRYVRTMQGAIQEIHAARKSNDDALVTETLNKFQEPAFQKSLPPPPSCEQLRNCLEVLVVSLSLAFGIRSLFIQPFKIPTGSMEPTLYGIHFTPADHVSHNKIARFFLYLNQSRTPIDITAKTDGRFNWESMQTVASPIPFMGASTDLVIGNSHYRVPCNVSQLQKFIYEFYQDKAIQGPLAYKVNDPLIVYGSTMYPILVRKDGMLNWDSLTVSPRSTEERPMTNVTIGSDVYELPGRPEDVKRNIIRMYLNPQTTRYFNLKAGETLLRGYAESGDHLFVNRLSFFFKEPQRGDIMVFKTDGLRDPSGIPFGGQYYVKRLVGLPGDTLKIMDKKLYVKEAGSSDFRLLDEKDNPGFQRIYSEKGRYHGYTQSLPSTQFLTSNHSEFVVPEGQYFMLGDNSENSRDSRFWGTVPRKNLIGSPIIVWWPFSRRMGLVDRLEPDPSLGETPANYPVIP